MKKDKDRTLGLVQLSLMSALILIMAFIPFLGYIPLGFTRATIIHIPVVIGSVLLGPKKGAFLGLLFGVTSLLNNTFNPTVTSFVFTPFYSVGDASGNALSLVICFLPRILVGIVPYYVYKGVRKMLKQKKGAEVVSLSAAGLAGSLVNTLLVMNFIYFFFGQSYAAARNISIEALYGVIMGVIGINGVPEAIVAAILTTAIGGALVRSRRKKNR